MGHLVRGLGLEFVVRSLVSLLGWFLSILKNGGLGSPQSLVIGCWSLCGENGMAAV